MAKHNRIAQLARGFRSTWRRPRAMAALLRHSSATFSQFGEDIVFDRLMAPTGAGIFVDVGANHPVVGSNTYRMYERGWRGLAIDPNPQFADLYRTYRPQDLYCAEGVSAKPASLIYFKFENDQFNTMDEDRAELLRGQGVLPVEVTSIPCRPLSMIVGEKLGNQQIDLLSVDCEGMDLEAIMSIDLTANRPTVIIVEDYQKYATFRDGGAPASLEIAMRGEGYLPISQTAWSAMFVACDWRRLFSRSGAFAEDRLDTAYLPG